MFILTLAEEVSGVFCIRDDFGDQVIPIFEEQDDAMRYHEMTTNIKDIPELALVEIDADDIINICEEKDQKYAIITPDELIIPPQDL
jgi:hypothetical protein